MKVAIYIRKSREDEFEKEDTLKRHETQLKEYCDKYDLRYTEEDIFREVVSGSKIENRPQMQRLLELVKNNAYDGVVVVELSRLTRGSGADMELITEVFRNSGTLIYTLNKIYNLSNGDELDEDMLELSLFLSRQEWKAIKRRMVRGRIQAQKEGYFVGSITPYGYDKERQGKGFVLVPNPVESEVIKMVYQKYAYENVGIAQLVDYLNSNDIKTKKGGRWNTSLLRKIIKHKVYLGYNNFNARGEQTYIKGKHEPLIDEDTYNIVIDRFMSKHSKEKASKELVNPLATFLRCSYCGRAMSIKKNVEFGRTIGCIDKSCPNISTYLADVEIKLIDELQEELKNFNYFLENIDEENKKIKINKEKVLSTVRYNINKKNEMINRCCEMLEEGIYSKNRYLERVESLEKELNELKNKLIEIESSDDSEEERIRSFIPNLEKVLKEYWNLKPKDKNILLKSIIEKVEYTKNKRNHRYNQHEDFVDLKIYLKI